MFKSRYDYRYEDKPKHNFKTMDKSELVHILFDHYDVKEAREDAENLKVKYGRNTIDVIEDRDIIGSLAHMAVEKAFEAFQIDCFSTRREMYNGGDKFDIAFMDDRLDVKGTHGEFNQWFYRKQFLIFTNQLQKAKMSEMTHFCFVEVNPDFSEAYIYGVISKEDFLEKSEPVKLRYDNQGIRAYDLTPLRKYIFHV